MPKSQKEEVNKEFCFFWQPPKNILERVQKL
jgi:hypothetical protein